MGSRNSVLNHSVPPGCNFEERVNAMTKLMLEKFTLVDDDSCRTSAIGAAAGPIEMPISIPGTVSSRQ